MKKTRLLEANIQAKANCAAKRAVKYFNLRWDPEVDNPFAEGTDCYVDVQSYIQGLVNGAQVGVSDSIYIQAAIENALHDFIESNTLTESRRSKRRPVKESIYCEEDVCTVPVSILQSIQNYVLGYYMENWDGIDPFDLDCRNDLEAEVEVQALDHGIGPSDSATIDHIQNLAIDTVFTYYDETCSSGTASVWD